MKITTLGTSQTTTVTNTGNLNLTISALTFANGASSAYTQNQHLLRRNRTGRFLHHHRQYSNAGGPAIDALTLTTNAFSASGVTIQLSH